MKPKGIKDIIKAIKGAKGANNNNVGTATNSNDIVEAAIGVKKGGEMSVEDALKGANPHYYDDASYQENCQRCVQAYEMRRRGYDVSANPKIVKGNNDTITWGSECFIKPGQYKYSRDAYSLSKTANDVEQELLSAPDGARYSVYVDWGNKNSHVFVAEKQNGKIRYLDPQTGESDVSRYFSKGVPNNFGYFRMDDKDFTTDINLIAATVKRR